MERNSLLKKGTEMKVTYRNIKAEAVRNGYTLEQLAEKMNVERKTIYNWGTRGNIPEKKLVEMANILNCPATALVGE